MTYTKYNLLKKHMNILMIFGILLIVNGGVSADTNVVTHTPFDRIFEAENVELNHTEGIIHLEILSEGKFSESGFYVSDPILIDEEFNTFMASWNSQENEDAGMIVSLRFSRDGWNWTPWREAFKEGNALIPLRARYIQYKVEMYTTDNTQTPEFSSFSFEFGDIPEENIDILDSYYEYQFAEGVYVEKPEIITRKGWGAAPPKNNYSKQTPKRIILHHSWRPNVSQYNGSSTIRGIQRYHQIDNGWNDVGYHYLIGPDGKIFEGRPPDAVGAHCPPNVNWVGICVIGDYDQGMDIYTEASQESVLKLMAWLCAGYRISHLELFGHTDFSSKSCPGISVYSEIPQYKNDLYNILTEASIR